MDSGVDDVEGIFSAYRSLPVENNFLIVLVSILMDNNREYHFNNRYSELFSMYSRMLGYTDIAMRSKYTCCALLSHLLGPFISMALMSCRSDSNWRMRWKGL